VADVDDDDAFERLLAREAEIRRRLEAGEIDDDEARELRDLAGEDPETDDGRLRLTLEQVARIADEGVDPKLVHALLRANANRLSVDAAIDLVADYEPDRKWIEKVAATGVGPLDHRQLHELLDNDVDLRTLKAAVVCDDANPIALAVMATERVSDPSEFLRVLGGPDGPRLSRAELEEAADHDLDPHDLARVLAAAPGLAPKAAVHLLAEGVDPHALESFGEDGIEIDVEALTRANRSISLLNLEWKGRQLLVGGGQRHIRRSGRVDGVFVGDLTIDPGVTVDIGATVIGDVLVEPGATVTISGRVTGNVGHRGTVPSA